MKKLPRSINIIIIVIIIIVITSAQLVIIHRYNIINITCSRADIRSRVNWLQPMRQIRAKLIMFKKYCSGTLEVRLNKYNQYFVLLLEVFDPTGDDPNKNFRCSIDRSEWEFTRPYTSIVTEVCYSGQGLIHVTFSIHAKAQNLNRCYMQNFVRLNSTTFNFVPSAIC